MTLDQMFNKSIAGLDKDLASALKKWKRLIFGKIFSISKIVKTSEEDIFQDFMLDMIQKYYGFHTDQYRYKGHTYVWTGKTLGAYVWIETPSWNKTYKYGKWILREQLIPISKACLNSYIYRNITQFQVDYLNKSLTRKRGFEKKICGKMKANIYSGSGKNGKFVKEIDRVVCRPEYKSISLDSIVGEDGGSYSDIIEDTRADIQPKIDLHMVLDVMAENMSEKGFEYAYRTKILGEALTMTKREATLFSREFDLVQKVLKGNDPLEVLNDGVAPVKFGMANVGR